MWILSIFFTRRPPFKAGVTVAQEPEWVDPEGRGLSSSSLGQDTPSWPQCVHQLVCDCCIEKDVLVSVCCLHQLFHFRFVCAASTSRSCKSHSDHRRALCAFAPDFIWIIIILTWIAMKPASLRLVVYLQHWCADWICAQMNRVVKMRKMCILALAEYELLYQHSKDTRYCRFTA